MGIPLIAPPVPSKSPKEHPRIFTNAHDNSLIMAPRKRKAPASAASTPSKKAKPVFESSDEELDDFVKIREYKMPGRAKPENESCNKHAHPAWPKEGTLTITGCMEVCEICGNRAGRNLGRHVRLMHALDVTGKGGAVTTHEPSASRLYDEVIIPKRGGQDRFLLDEDDEEIMLRAGILNVLGTAEDEHVLNKTTMQALKTKYAGKKINPLTGRPGSRFVREMNKKKKEAAAAAKAQAQADAKAQAQADAEKNRERQQRDEGVDSDEDSEAGPS